MGIGCGMARSLGFSDEAGLSPSGVGGTEDRPDPILELCIHGVSIPSPPCVSGLCTEAQTDGCTFLPDCWTDCAAVNGQGSGRLSGIPSGSGPCKYAPATSRIPDKPILASATSTCWASSVTFGPTPWLLGECTPLTFTKPESLTKPWSR